MSTVQHTPQVTAPGLRTGPAPFPTALLLTLLLSGCGQPPAPPADTPPAPTDPMAQDTPPPFYPPELGCRQIGGQTLVDVALNAAGIPERVTVARSSGTPALDEAAVDAVRGWKFRPATVRGAPAPSKLQVPVTFVPPNPPPDECNQYL